MARYVGLLSARDQLLLAFQSSFRMGIAGVFVVAYATNYGHVNHNRFLNLLYSIELLNVDCLI